MGPGSGHLGYLRDCCALIDFDQCEEGLLRVLTATLPVATTRLVAGEWPAIDEPRCAALGLPIVEESEAQLAEIATARAGLSLADRSALIVARDAPYILVTNDKALHRIGGSSGVSAHGDRICFPCWLLQAWWGGGVQSPTCGPCRRARPGQRRP